MMLHTQAGLVWQLQDDSQLCDQQGDHLCSTCNTYLHELPDMMDSMDKSHTGLICGWEPQ